MNHGRFEIKAPIDWLPAGLISWYDASGTPMAQVTSWIALIGGDDPRLKTAWHSLQDLHETQWEATDFVLNIPTETGLQKIRKIIARGNICNAADSEFGFKCERGVISAAPRLVQCAIQIECRNGMLSTTGTDKELCGDVVQVHHGHTAINPVDIADLCAIQPFNPDGC